MRGQRSGGKTRPARQFFCKLLIGIGVADFFGFSAGSAATLAAAFLAIAGTLGAINPASGQY